MPGKKKQPPNHLPRTKALDRSGIGKHAAQQQKWFILAEHSPTPCVPVPCLYDPVIFIKWSKSSPLALWNPTPISYYYLLAAVLNLAAALMIWSRTELDKEIRRLSLILLCISLWLTTGFVELSLTSPGLKLRAVEIGDAFSGLANLSMLLFVLDYFRPWPWFNRRWRWILWGFMIAVISLSLTNSLHHLIWRDAVLIPPLEDNLARYSSGRLYNFSNAVYISLIALSFALLIRQVFISQKGERRFIGLVTTALAVPFSAYFVYALNASHYAGMIAMPVAYAASAGFMVWVVYDHMQSMIASQAESLKRHVADLQLEIQHRKKLEADLKKSREILAEKIADQSSRMTGIYDLILLGAQQLPEPGLQEQSMEKILSILDCSALCFYEQQGSAFTLIKQAGLSYPIPPILTAFSADHTNSLNDGALMITAEQEPRLFHAVSAAGCSAALARKFPLHNGSPALLLALWGSPIQFSIDELALFNGLSDGLLLILEIARLSQGARNEARQAERRRLARDLHDSVTQSLHSLNFSAETALSQMEENPELLKKTLEHLKTSSWQALKEMRLLLYELRLQQPGDSSLQDLVQTRLEAVERRAGIAFTIQVDQTFLIPRNLEVELYPVIMESLNNALKHSRAASVSVHFSCSAGLHTITVQDDGVGFEPDALTPGGMGIQNMRERCRKLDAHLSLDSSPGSGTTVQISIPLPAASKPETENLHG